MEEVAVAVRAPVVVVLVVDPRPRLEPKDYFVSKVV